MQHKRPKFWSSKTSWLSTLLVPASFCYLLGHKLYQKRRKPYHASIPVICVGNAVVGGSGKTPTTLALIDMLKDKGFAKNPYILTRGYGGTLVDPVLVDPNVHGTRHVGDEALLLARKAPVIKSADRAAGARMAEEMGADLILMDDGLQNPSLYQDIKILVIDSIFGFGNERLLPAGPMRAPLNGVLHDIDLMVTIGKRTDSYALFSLNEEAPTVWAYLEANKKVDLSKRYIAFAGIGLPEKFKRTLEKEGAEIVAWHDFPDHYPYSAGDMMTLNKEAEKHKAQLITTEKDFVRVPLAYQKYVESLPVSLVFEEEEELMVFFNQRLGHR